MQDRSWGPGVGLSGSKVPSCPTSPLEILLTLHLFFVLIVVTHLFNPFHLLFLFPLSFFLLKRLHQQGEVRGGPQGFNIAGRCADQSTLVLGVHLLGPFSWPPVADRSAGFCPIQIIAPDLKPWLEQASSFPLISAP